MFEMAEVTSGVESLAALHVLEVTDMLEGAAA